MGKIKDLLQNEMYDISSFEFVEYMLKDRNMKSQMSGSNVSSGAVSVKYSDTDVINAIRVALVGVEESLAVSMETKVMNELQKSYQLNLKDNH
jgi:hypothetical protein